MAANLTFHADGRFVECHLSGKLDKADYKQLGPKFDELIQEHGKLKMLVVLKDFHGWTMGGLWEDIKLDVRHYRDIEKLAIVGEKKWHEGMATFCKPFTTAKIKYFEGRQLAEARRWLGAEGAAAAESQQPAREYR